MLYCPKCQATYEDGTQRFCTNEGARLLPYATSEKSGQSSKGVFSSILSKSSPKKEGSILSQTESGKKKSRSSAFQPPSQSKFFKAGKSKKPVEQSEPVVEEMAQQKEEPEQRKSFETLPLARIINPISIPEKQSESDRVFSAEPEKIKPKNRSIIDFSGVDRKVVEESFEVENKDSIKADENESSISMKKNVDPDITEDVPFKLIDAPQMQDEFELDLENDESGFSNSESEINLDLGLDEDSGANSNFDIDFSEPIKSFERNSGIELEIDELDYISVPSESLEKIELDLDNIEDDSISEPASARVELDLESRKEINLADSIPRIELDLAELDQVSIPSASEPAEPAELTGDTEIETQETPTAPVTIEKQEEEKAETEEESDAKEKAKAAVAGTSKIKATEDTAWEKRSIDPPGEEESRWFLYPLIGIVILGLGLLGFFYLTNQNNSVNEGQINSQTENLNQPNSITNTNTNTNTETTSPNENTAPGNENITQFQADPNTELIEVPPPPQTIQQPPNTIYFKNEKKIQKGKLAQGFLGFSIYYPKTWKVNKRDDKFLDISLTTPQGLLKQLLIERYDSKGTFLADKALFKGLVEKSDRDLRRIFTTNYQVISEGETKFQGGRWQVYEVKFQGVADDKNLITWGRRLWIPVQKPGMKSGFIITMIGTSLSDDVKSVADLGENDDLAEILKTFEPELN